MPRNGWLIAMAALFYLATRLFQLTTLPIFADEAIYIRWSQQMAKDSSLAFLPLYDGKTPLFMWLMVPFLQFSLVDPLWSARLTSVVVGILGMWALKEVTKLLGGHRLAQWLAVGLYLLTPATFFHDRMGLIDGLFLALSATFLMTLLLTLKNNSWWWAFSSGVLLGLVLLTKLPGLFLLPVFFALPFLWKLLEAKRFSHANWFRMAAILLIGFSLFSITRFSIWFPFLFQRSSDFRYSVEEFVSGGYLGVIRALPTYADWLVRYFGAGTLALPILTAYLLRKQKDEAGYKSLVLLFLGLMIIVPFVLAGKIVYSRYFLPALIFIIPAAALAAEQLRRTGWGRLLSSVGLLIVVQGILFITPALWDPARIPFAPQDAEQYLTSWSSGHGITQVVNYLTMVSKTQEVVVASEGFFGTLPDGLFVYLDGSPVLDNVEIYGVGQPIGGVPVSLKEKAVNGKSGYIVANQHRIDFEYGNECETILSEPRPLQGPPLLLLKCL